MKFRKNAFTLMELMVVILIVGVLAAAIIPIMRGKIDASKWTEANAAAGMLRQTHKVYFMESGQKITGPLNDTTKLDALGLDEADLTGTYFSTKDYAITAVNANGVPTVKVTGSQTNAPTGSRTLTVEGEWQ